MTRPSLLRIFCVFAVLCLLGEPARAKKPDPGEKFNEGLSLFQAGQHEEAADAFYEAYRARPHAAALYNAGLAWQLAGDLGRAATAYSLALEMKLGDSARADARKRLDELGSSVGRIEVGAPEVGAPAGMAEVLVTELVAPVFRASSLDLELAGDVLVLGQQRGDAVGLLVERALVKHAVAQLQLTRGAVGEDVHRAEIAAPGQRLADLFDAVAR